MTIKEVERKIDVLQRLLKDLKEADTYKVGDFVELKFEDNEPFFCYGRINDIEGTKITCSYVWWYSEYNEIAQAYRDIIDVKIIKKVITESEFIEHTSKLFDNCIQSFGLDKRVTLNG